MPETEFTSANPPGMPDALIEHRHFMLFKPFGFLSQFKTDSKKKKLLGELFPFPEGTMAIGRLDEDSEGLLLLTTNGKISELVRSRHVAKEYCVQVDGLVTDEALQLMRNGLEVRAKKEFYQTLPCKAERLEEEPDLPGRARNIRAERHGPTSWISITLAEGKYRQIRKMTAAVGFPTLRLVRVRIGNLLLENMQPGQVIELSEAAVVSLPHDYTPAS